MVHFLAQTPNTSPDDISNMDSIASAEVTLHVLVPPAEGTLTRIFLRNREWDPSLGAIRSTASYLRPRRNPCARCRIVSVDPLVDLGITT